MKKYNKVMKKYEMIWKRLEKYENYCKIRYDMKIEERAEG